MSRLVSTTAVSVLAALIFATAAAPASADEWITEADVRHEINFPETLSFYVEFASDRPVESVTISFGIIGREILRNEPATLIEGDPMRAEYILETRGGSGSLFIPTGAGFEYRWIFQDAEGNRVETDPVEFIYLDTRFEWEVLTEGLVSTYYYGPTNTRAQTILDTSIETLSRMGAVLQTELTDPIRIMIYNNPLQMQAALPFTSNTAQSGLVTLGQAYGSEGILLIMGFTSQIRGTTSHEVTHLLVAQAAEGPGRRVPDWLNEGLAEYGNLEPSYSYDLALLENVRTGRLLPITGMNNQPGTPDETILFYGQARAIVEFMIDEYGPGKMAELLRTFRDGYGNMDDVLVQVYGFDRVGLDNRWRSSIGLPLLPEREVVEDLATATPIPTLVPLGARTPTPVVPDTPETIITGDLNRDGSVDRDDLAVLQGAYGTGSGDSGYAAEIDLNGDGVINYLDLAMLGAEL